MIYEMRTYTVKVGKLQSYLNHFETKGLPIISRYTTLVGFWYTEIGELNQVVHIWAYPNLNERAKKREALYQDVRWLEEFIPEALPMLERQETKILNAANFSPIR